ncbi:phosphorylcholine transferase LicD [Segatella asaccharophila]|jgi:lipopolysaccharide cholinephosphotransferase
MRNKKSFQIEGSLFIVWKKELVKIFKQFDVLCSKYNLTYFCNGGTAIGAVRHHGFIPWDDDIDVMMPRPDYEKLLDIFRIKNVGNLEIITPEKDENYYLTYAKLYDKNTTLLENKCFHCLIGVFIDIFPLDGAPKNPKHAKRLYDRYQKLRLNVSLTATYYGFTDLMIQLIKLHWKDVFRILFICSFRKRIRRKSLSGIHKIIQEVNYEGSEYINEYDDYYGYKLYQPKEWYEGTREFPFEDMNVKLPKEYDKYLTHIFGDYMQYPPLSEQKSHHYVAYLNLEKRETIEEVLAKLKHKK